MSVDRPDGPEGGIAARVAAVQARIAEACAKCGRDPGFVELLPVSKRHPGASIRAAMAVGMRAFGENRVQELSDKAEEFSRDGIDVEWQMIGSVQSKKAGLLAKVKNLALLQTLDRAKLADVLQREFDAEGRGLRVLLQVDATNDASKHGVRPDEAVGLSDYVDRNCPRIEIVGVMAMGPRETDPGTVFGTVASVRSELEQRLGRELPVLSLGMTGDLDAAIAAGSTQVRVGTGIFGERPDPR